MNIYLEACENLRASSDINLESPNARFFYKLIYKPSYCNFPEGRKK